MMNSTVGINLVSQILMERGKQKSQKLTFAGCFKYDVTRILRILKNLGKIWLKLFIFLFNLLRNMGTR